MRANHFLQDRPRAGERSDSTLANGLSGAHCQAMGYVLLKIVDFLIAICVAWVVAVTVWYVAHYVFGAFGLDVRTSALTAAAIFALLVATEWFEKKSK